MFVLFILKHFVYHDKSENRSETIIEPNLTVFFFLFVGSLMVIFRELDLISCVNQFFIWRDSDYGYTVPGTSADRASNSVVVRLEHGWYSYNTTSTNNLEDIRSS